MFSPLTALAFSDVESKEKKKRGKHFSHWAENYLMKRKSRKENNNKCIYARNYYAIFLCKWKCLIFLNKWSIV